MATVTAGVLYVFGTWWQDRKQEAGGGAVASPEALKKRRSQLRVSLRAGVAGDAQGLDRLYRALAFRYHPDNLESGNVEIFL